MALVNLSANIPEMPRSSGTPPAFGSALTIDASGEKAAVIFRAPKTGAIRKIRWCTGTVVTGDTVDVRLETVDLATGDPTGTLQGTTTNGAQVVAGADDNVSFATQLTADASVTMGDVLAIVIVNGAVPGNITINRFGDDSLYFPYVDLFTSSWAKSNTAAAMSVEYSDGSYAPITGLWPFSLINTVSFNSTSTPDERGLIWTPPADCRVVGAWMWADLDGDADIVLYDPDGVTPLGTVALDANLRGTTDGGLLTARFPAAITLAAGSAYRLVVKPGSTTLSLYDFDVSAAAVMDAFQGGQAMHYTSAKDPTGTGDWTQVTTKRAWMGFILDQFDDGAGGGGGGGPLLGGRLVS